MRPSGRGMCDAHVDNEEIEEDAEDYVACKGCQCFGIGTLSQEWKVSLI